MKNRQTIRAFSLLMALLSLSAGVACGDASPMTPELAARREMVRSQQDQRLTHEKKKAAAEALKAARLKVHQARQAVKGMPPAEKN